MYFGYKYSSRVDTFDSFKPDDITKKVSDLLTSGCYFTSMDEFCSRLDKDESFVPFGEMVDKLTVTQDGKERHFEFYNCDAKTPGFVAFHTRLQTFVMWFVDAASYLDLDDPQWMFYVWWVDQFADGIFWFHFWFLVATRNIPTAKAKLCMLRWVTQQFTYTTHIPSTYGPE